MRMIRVLYIIHLCACILCISVRNAARWCWCPCVCARAPPCPPARLARRSNQSSSQHPISFQLRVAEKIKTIYLLDANAAALYRDHRGVRVSVRACALAPASEHYILYAFGALGVSDGGGWGRGGVVFKSVKYGAMMESLLLACLRGTRSRPGCDCARISLNRGAPAGAEQCVCSWRNSKRVAKTNNNNKKWHILYAASPNGLQDSAHCIYRALGALLIAMRVSCDFTHSDEDSGRCRQTVAAVAAVKV